MQTNEVISITKDPVVPTAEKMRAEGRLLVMIHGLIENDGTHTFVVGFALPGMQETL